MIPSSLRCVLGRVEYIFFCKIMFIYLVGGHMPATAYMWSSRNRLEAVLVIQFGSKHLYQLSHLTHVTLEIYCKWS